MTASWLKAADHAQWKSERKTTIGLIDLGRGYAQVEHNHIHAFQSQTTYNAFHLRKRSVMHFKPVERLGQFLAVIHGNRIAVQSDVSTLGFSGE